MQGCAPVAQGDQIRDVVSGASRRRWAQPAQITRRSFIVWMTFKHPAKPLTGLPVLPQLQRYNRDVVREKIWTKAPNTGFPEGKCPLLISFKEETVTRHSTDLRAVFFVLKRVLPQLHRGSPGLHLRRRLQAEDND